jgi:hypothetical protein
MKGKLTALAAIWLASGFERPLTSPVLTDSRLPCLTVAMRVVDNDDLPGCFGISGTGDSYNSRRRLTKALQPTLRNPSCRLSAGKGVAHARLINKGSCEIHK